MTSPFDLARQVTIEQGHPLSYGRRGYRDPLVFNRGVGEAPVEGTPAWERANLWKTGLVVGGVLVVIVGGALLFLGAPPPPRHSRPPMTVRR